VTVPDRLIAEVPSLPPRRSTRTLARQAERRARQACPKLSGAAAGRLEAIWGQGWIGVRFADPYIWYQEKGIRPFTMKSLAGKAVPMWLDDPDGSVLRDNPKAQTRTMAGGRRQTLIFRRATNPGARKITARGPGGRIAPGGTKVAWRFPGMHGKDFIRDSLTQVLLGAGVPVGEIYASDSSNTKIAAA
jgi:hypothetical protein